VLELARRREALAPEGPGGGPDNAPEVTAAGNRRKSEKNRAELCVPAQDGDSSLEDDSKSPPRTGNNRVADIIGRVLRLGQAPGDQSSRASSSPLADPNLNHCVSRREAHMMRFVKKLFGGHKAPAACGRKRTTVRLQVEGLEERSLMAAG